MILNTFKIKEQIHYLWGGQLSFTDACTWIINIFSVHFGDMLTLIFFLLLNRNRNYLIKN